MAIAPLGCADPQGMIERLLWQYAEDLIAAIDGKMTEERKRQMRPVANDLRKYLAERHG